MTLAEYIAREVRVRAEAQGLSQTAISEAAQVSRMTVWAVYHARRLVAADRIAAIAHALGCEVGDLFPPRRTIRRYLETRSA